MIACQASTVHRTSNATSRYYREGWEGGNNPSVGEHTEADLKTARMEVALRPGASYMEAPPALPGQGQPNSQLYGLAQAVLFEKQGQGLDLKFQSPGGSAPGKGRKRAFSGLGPRPENPVVFCLS